MLSLGMEGFEQKYELEWLIDVPVETPRDAAIAGRSKWLSKNTRGGSRSRSRSSHYQSTPQGEEDA